MIGAILKREDNRITRARTWRRVGWLLAFAWLTGAGTWVRADAADASTNSPGAPAPLPAWMSPSLLSTNNAASSTFLESHPELAQPYPPGQKDLSLRPGASSTNEPPEISPPSPSPGISPETLPPINPAGQPDDLPAHLLVVYNINDPDSKGLAEYYAARRNIPPERVLPISCPVTEEITRAQYEETLRVPITSYLCQKKWMTRQTQQVHVGDHIWDLLVAAHNDIWAIVLMRGVPLKIAPDPSDEDGMETSPELQTNAAAVDSELALLPIFGLPKGGYVPNVFFDSRTNGLKRAGPELARNIILVTRLDGPKPSDVRRMIDDSLYAEKNRLAGLAVIDTRGLTDVKDGFTQGDTWLRAARDLLVQDGWCVKFDDRPEVIPATDPCNQVALYLGWYTSDAMGPWVTPPRRFVRGAIAYHLHSFSANTVRSETSNWVGPLIAHGAAATMGTVYEPYLALTPHEDIFTRRLLEGDYFAEAAYASEPGLSWMVTVVGDPLYRPFRQPLDSALAADIPSDHRDWLLLQTVQRKLVAGQLEAKTDSLEEFLDLPDAGPVAEEGLGDLLEKLHGPEAEAAAGLAYQKATSLEFIPMDRIRVGLKLAQLYTDHNQDEQAQTELKSLRELYPQEAIRFGLAPPLVPTTAPSTNSPVSQPPTVPGPPKPKPALPQLPSQQPAPE